MNKDDIKKVLSNISENCKGISIYVVDEENNLLSSDIESDLLDSTKILFCKNINTKYVGNEKLTTIPLSLHDDRNNVLYQFDFDEKPIGFEHLTNAINRRADNPLPIFKAKDSKLKTIKALIIVLKDEDGVCSAFYQHISNFSILSSEKKMNFFVHKTRLTLLDTDVLRISVNFAIMLHDGKFYIENVGVLENQLNFKKVIHQRAEIYAEDLIEAKYSDNFDIFMEKIKEDTSFARKVVKICRHSSVLDKNINPKDLIEFAKNELPYSEVLKFNDDETSFDLMSIKRCKTFLELLDDELLISKLTGVSYMSKVKDKVKP